MTTENNDWTNVHEVWDTFVTAHPELCYRPGRMNLHNFLRHHRATLVQGDAIRKAKGRYWIAHRARFLPAAFDAATGAPVLATTAPTQDAK